MIPLSLVIPAHDEAEWIGGALLSLLAQDHDGVLDAIVVANGCHDDTAARARALADRFADRGWSLRVADLAAGGKPGALNHGDDMARHAARIYMDADIRPGPRMLRLLARALDRPHPVYASGRLTVPSAASRISRHYARFWTRLPFVAEGVPGAGLFAVNGPGRARWGRFPAIISDDTYARLHFAPAERIRVAEDFTWPVVEGFPALVAVRRRQDAGVDEIRRLFPQLLANAQDRRPARAETLRLAAADPGGFAAYAAVALAVRLRPQGRDWTRGR